MVSNQSAATAFDLAPLTWVLPDLRKSLPLAVSAARQFYLESKSHENLPSGGARTAPLQDARRLFHQARSALEMIGQNTAAKLLIASGDLVKAFSAKPEACTEEAVIALEKAQIALLDYLEALLKGRRAFPLGLFSQYRALLDVSQVQRIHPADLSMQDWSWQKVDLLDAIEPVDLTPRLKSQLGQALLKLLNAGDAVAAGELAAACAGLGVNAPSWEMRSFWMLAAGFFEAYQHKLMRADVFAKRTASQIIQQLNAVSLEGVTASESVAQDATFFCLLAKIENEHLTPCLAAVQRAYGAMERPQGDYNLVQYGRFDPVQLDFLRRRLAAFSESWSALVGGDMGRSASVLEHLTAVGETLQKLNPESTALAHALRRAVEMSVKSGAKANPLLAMEVATTLLYLEAVYEDTDPSSDATGERMDVLAMRLGQVCEGQAPAAVEPWMEALYRRLSERQSMGSVTNELRVSLAAVETALERYLRDPLDSSILSIVSGHLSQMYGVFSVLGLQQAASAVFKIRETLDSHLSVEKRKRPIPLAVYEQIARSVSTMGFLIDMLNYQIAIAKEMFVFDSEAGEFTYLNGRRAGTQRIILPMAPKPPSKKIEVNAPLPGIRVTETKAALQAVPQSNAMIPSLPAARQDAEDDGAEILDIFLDEVASVLEDAQHALLLPGSDPAQFDDLLLIRRAFHTLKGGARMVGQDVFGEAAWAFEQLMNQWMAEQKPPTTDLLGLVGQALKAFSNWSQDIKQGDTLSWNGAIFRNSADAMRLEARWIPLQQPGEDMQIGAYREAPTEMLRPTTSPKDALPDSDVLDDAPLAPYTFSPQLGQDLPIDLMVLTGQRHSEEGYDKVDTEDGLAPDTNFGLVDLVHSVVPVHEAAVPRSPALDFPEAFYTVFISETSEWAERLFAQVSAWSDADLDFSPRSAQDLAHSIRGNCAAMGVQAIADLAQSVERALDHLQGSSLAVIGHISLFQEAAQTLLSMVQECAKRRVAQPQPALLARLHAIQTDGVMADPHAAYTSPLEISGEPGSGMDSLFGLAPNVPATSAVSDAAGLAPVAPPVPSLLILDDDDPLDSKDQLDHDLLPVFQEEGAELMPALGSALRQWVARPGEAAHRAQILRLLHTLKGSGRLTGAFRLGELAHRMESGIEQLALEGTRSSQIEPFLTRFDQLQSIFEGLGQGVNLIQQGQILRSAGQDVPQNASVPTDAINTVSEAQRPLPAMLTGLIRVRASVVERLVDEAGEVSVYRSRAETHLSQMTSALGDLSQTLDRLALQLRELELQADMRIQSRNTATTEVAEQFDPLEFDRFTRLQEIARMMAEAVGDVSTVRRNVQTALYASQQDLEQQSRQLRELQRDLLRMRLVDFDVIADRLYSVVRQTAKELGKQVTLDLEGGNIELDRSVLERMAPSFEHLLRNALVHGIEPAQDRQALGKPVTGAIKVSVSQEGNDVAIHFSDDGRGLSMQGIRDRAQGLGLINQDQILDREATTRLLFMPGFTTATQVTELAGRGIGLDVVLSEVNALGGRIETQSEEGQGTRFKLVLPLTTAVTQVLMFRAGAARFGIPAGLVETVIRVLPKMLESAYADGQLITEQGHGVPFYGSGPLLQIKQDPADPKAKTHPVLILRSAGQGLALHVDEVLGNREVVVKNMGPQLSRLPGLAGITVLPSGETTLIYNPIALAKVYGDAVRKTQAMGPQSDTTASASQETQAPLILVVDDALTVRRVIQRLLLREGYRVALANDGVHALQVLEQQRPLMVLSDIEMPRMDGFELARSIRSRPEYADLPIVMITSRIAQKHRDHAMSLGVNHYLGKPYSESELLGLIRDQVQATSNAAALLQALDV